MIDCYGNLETGELIRLSRSSDDAAFGELVARYTPMMNKVIAGFGSSVRYDEAFSEGCVALHRAALSYDFAKADEITFGLYARICVYRKICDLVASHSHSPDVLSLDVELISTESNIEQNLVRRESLSKYFDKARGILSEYEYLVFRLFVDGYSTQEMVAALGSDAKSVENAKGRMLKKLRREGEAFFDV
ncbi:MAG: hypothetical protein J6V09_05815 [Clostridia bacterium]|nr:hypothetical protein [Clostridia bacterium]